MDTKLSPQAKLVLHHLRREGSISGIEAAGIHKIRHLPRRIADLKEAGFNIRAEQKRDVNNQRYVRYHLNAPGD